MHGDNIKYCCCPACYLLTLTELSSFYAPFFAAPRGVPQGQHAVGCVDGGALFCLLRHLGLWVGTGGWRRWSRLPQGLFRLVGQENEIHYVWRSAPTSTSYVLVDTISESGGCRARQTVLIRYNYSTAQYSIVQCSAVQYSRVEGTETGDVPCTFRVEKRTRFYAALSPPYFWYYCKLRILVLALLL